MSKCLVFLDKHLVSLAILAVLVVILFATTGCRALDGALEDVAGTATALRKITAPLAAKADEKDAEQNAKWLLVWQAEQNAYATIGHNPTAFPKKVKDK